MRVVFTLLVAYFTGTAWQRWLTAIGIAVIVFGIFGIELVWGSFVLQAVCFAGCCAFFAGSALMPRVFGQLARSHAIYFLPFGRLKLLASALLTTFIVSLPLPILSVLVSRGVFSRELLNAEQSLLPYLLQFIQLPFLWNMVADVFYFCTFLYVVLWFLTTSRTVLGKVATLLITVALLSVPPKFVSIYPDAPIAPVVIVIVASWLVFAGAFLFWPRRPQRNSGELNRRLKELLPSRVRTEYAPGKEIALMLGIANPGILALAIVFCIVLDTLFIPPGGPWLFFLSILAIVTSAISGFAVTRSRTLWLRRPWLRNEMFDRIEVFLWRQNTFSLSVLVIWFVTVGSYANVAIATLALGIPLVLLSAAVSLYLSLMQTRGLRWLDGMLAIATTLLIMAIAVFAGREDIDLPMVIALEVILAISVPLLRSAARRRWSNLDWALCRAPSRAATSSA